MALDLNEKSVRVYFVREKNWATLWAKQVSGFQERASETDQERVE